jgi:hypothetical protein
MTLWDDDQELMQALGEALRGEVSETARSAARAAFAWGTIDEDLMSLSHDSSLNEEVLVRSAATGAHVLGFEGRDFTFEVELDAGSLMGQVVPGRVCLVSVLSPGQEPLWVHTDESGFFSLPAPVGRPVRFTVSYDGVTQSTDWLSL